MRSTISLLTLAPAALVALSYAAPVSANTWEGGDFYGAHIKVRYTRGNSQQLYALLLSSYVSGTRLAGIWYANSGPCSTNTDALDVYMLRTVDR